MEITRVELINTLNLKSVYKSMSWLISKANLMHKWGKEINHGMDIRFKKSHICA